MSVRDATPADCDRLASLIGCSRGAVRDMLANRTVRVVVDSGSAEGVVVFDADESAVQLTRIAGEPPRIRRLLGEPIGFAAKVGLPVETVVPESERELRQVLAEAGFEEIGIGPRFRDEETVRLRRMAGSADSEPGG